MAKSLKKRRKQFRKLKVPKYKDYYILLAEAAAIGDTKTMRILLAVGIGPDTPVFHHTPAIVAAVARRQAKAVKLLMRYNASVHDGDDFGFTPLMAAASNGDLKMVRLMLDNHADPDRTDGEHNALFYAQQGVQRMRQHIGCMLFENGKVVVVQSDLHRKQCEEYEEVIKLLQEASAKKSSLPPVETDC